ncbi:mediator of RNA polymerase II transcription subunit 11 isoform X1 [Anguilla rostrata]|uniref:mediator of RNA polymerase II transcription subunit 11 isoform X1 n=1 Tax=Anguilla rostrata TaxID=7938 RepID=UPI0030D3B8C9
MFAFLVLPHSLSLGGFREINRRTHCLRPRCATNRGLWNGNTHKSGRCWAGVMANERLRALEDVEREIAVVLQCAGNVVLELSKEKHNASLLDRQLTQFTGSINRVENELSSQIRYLTQVATGQPHEGSTYSARKDCQMALNRAEYARVKLGELGRTCEIMLDPQT